MRIVAPEKPPDDSPDQGAAGFDRILTQDVDWAIEFVTDKFGSRPRWVLMHLEDLWIWAKKRGLEMPEGKAWAYVELDNGVKVTWGKLVPRNVIALGPYRQR